MKRRRTLPWEQALIAAICFVTACFITLWMSASIATAEEAHKASLASVASVEQSLKRAPSPLDDQPLNALDQAVQWVRKSHERLHNDIHDYTCTLDFRMRVEGELSEMKKVQAKVRHDKTITDGLSLYLKFDSPKSVSGREVLFCNTGDNDRMLVRRGGPRLAFLTMELEPTCAMAMKGNLYPITEFGLRNLANRMLQCAEEELDAENCKVSIDPHTELDGQSCTFVEVLREEKSANAKFHRARIYFSHEHRIPVRYEAYDWPEVADGEPTLKEEYTYRNLELNVGLTDADFDRANSAYRFSKRD